MDAKNLILYMSFICLKDEGLNPAGSFILAKKQTKSGWSSVVLVL